MMRKPQLFTIHFAGGNAYSLNFLTDHLKANFEIHVLELPGRGKRMAEDLIEDHEEAVKDVYTQISSKLTRDQFMIYGHSMGANLAFHVTQLLEKEGKFPLQIILTGNPGPNVPRKENWHHLPTTEFFDKLKILGGVPDEFFQSEELMEFFEPIIRTDFKLSEMSNETSCKDSIKSPLLAIMGSEEELADHVGNWENYTSGKCETMLLDGDHFFIHNKVDLLAEMIKTIYDTCKAL
jgi:external thioesterase TEII